MAAEGVNIFSGCSDYSGPRLKEFFYCEKSSDLDAILHS